MVTYDEYLKNILRQITDSHQTLFELQDRPGDLEIIKLELIKINGLFQVISKKLEENHYPHIDLSGLKGKVRHFQDSYYFEREIEIMAPLYSEDPNRVKNIRIKILEGLNDKKLMEKIEDIFRELE